MIGNGTKVELHTKVNIDPLGSHCSLCGRQTNARLWFPLGWDGLINTQDADQSDLASEAIWGWWPVGSECAKQFEHGVVIERN